MVGETKIPLRLLFKALLTLAVLLVPMGAQAQTGAVVGAVRDEAGLPLPGVNVVLEGTTRGDATDLNGRYRIEQISVGSYVVRASAVGYQAEQQPITVAAGEEMTAFDYPRYLI